MFQVQKLSYRPWPVVVSQWVCDESSGEVAELKSTFVARFKVMSEEEIAAAHDAVFKVSADESADVPAQAAAEPLAVALRKNAAFFGDVLVGWGPEVVGGDRQPLPYSREALVALVTGPDGLAVSSGLNHALTQLRYGLRPELAKNSPASPVDGPKTAGAEASETASS